MADAAKRKKEKIYRLNVHETPLLDLLNSDSEEEIIEDLIKAARTVARNNTIMDDGRTNPARVVAKITMEKLQWHVNRLEVVRRMKSRVKVE